MVDAGDCSQANQSPEVNRVGDLCVSPMGMSCESAAAAASAAAHRLLLSIAKGMSCESAQHHRAATGSLAPVLAWGCGRFGAGLRDAVALGPAQRRRPVASEGSLRRL